MVLADWYLMPVTLPAEPAFRAFTAVWLTCQGYRLPLTHRSDLSRHHMAHRRDYEILRGVMHEEARRRINMFGDVLSDFGLPVNTNIGDARYIVKRIAHQFHPEKNASQRHNIATSVDNFVAFHWVDGHR